MRYNVPTLGVAMKQTVIPAGYRVTISSWENDADARQDEILEGLTKERVQYLVDLCSLFKSSSQGKQYHGNMYDPSEKEIHRACLAIVLVMNKHREALTEDELEVLNEDDLGSIGDFMTDFLGELLGRSENYWVRVFDGMKIEYVPVSIILNDVTEEFM
jgi:hypothetical protein